MSKTSVSMSLRDSSESESDMEPLRKVDKMILMAAVMLSTQKMIDEMLLMMKKLILSMV